MEVRLYLFLKYWKTVSKYLFKTLNKIAFSLRIREKPSYLYYLKENIKITLHNFFLPLSSFRLDDIFAKFTLHFPNFHVYF